MKKLGCFLTEPLGGWVLFYCFTFPESAPPPGSPQLLNFGVTTISLSSFSSVMHTNTNTIKTTPHNAVTNTYSDPGVEFSYQAGKVVIKQKKQS